MVGNHQCPNKVCLLSSTLFAPTALIELGRSMRRISVVWHRLITRLIQVEFSRALRSMAPSSTQVRLKRVYIPGTMPSLLGAY